METKAPLILKKDFPGVKKGVILKYREDTKTYVCLSPYYSINEDEITDEWFEEVKSNEYIITVGNHNLVLKTFSSEHEVMNDIEDFVRHHHGIEETNGRR